MLTHRTHLTQAQRKKKKNADYNQLKYEIARMWKKKKVEVIPVQEYWGQLQAGLKSGSKILT